MQIKLKPLSQQTIVVTGATSGIGLCTARMAAHRGANVVARNEEALIDLVHEITAAGGSATYAVADVADEEALERAAQTARQEFGVIDTWVNNAGTSIYGRIMEVSTEDMRRLFETSLLRCRAGETPAVPGKSVRKSGHHYCLVLNYWSYRGNSV